MVNVIAPEPMRVHVTPEILDYVLAHSSVTDGVLLRLVETTKQRFGQQAGMQIAPEQGALISLLTRLTRAQNAVEVGTFTGYSSVCIARALQPGGRLLCLDISTEWTSLAAGAWAEAGISDRVELRIGPAIDALRELPRQESIDFSFVDADKVGYSAYYDELLPRTRPGGLLLFDNVLFAGKVLRDSDEPNPAALRAFNDRIAADDRVEVAMLPLADGFTIARKL
jgi:caffeoyl-CoA O-methyltransferase